MDPADERTHVSEELGLYDYDCPGCGHRMHDAPCAVPVFTPRFEGTNHGGFVPCGHI
jgi:hypothetical protein